MSDDAPRISDVATWHRLSGCPDNVTEEGLIVEVSEAQRLQVEKQALRRRIADLRDPGLPAAVHNLARLAAGYLLAGDVETASRYVTMAHDLLGQAQ